MVIQFIDVIEMEMVVAIENRSQFRCILCWDKYKEKNHFYVAHIIQIKTLLINILTKLVGI